jgi:hypothetical protein
LGLLSVTNANAGLQIQCSDFNLNAFLMFDS